MGRAAAAKKVWDATKKKLVYEYQKRASDKKVRKALLKKKKEEGEAAMKKAEAAIKAEASEAAPAAAPGKPFLGRKSSPEKGTSLRESLNWRKKLSREQKKRDLNEAARVKRRKKPTRIEEMTSERLKREKTLANPYMTYEERAKYLGGMKKGGEVKKRKPTKEELRKIMKTGGGGKRFREIIENLLGPIKNLPKEVRGTGRVRRGAVHRMPDGTLMKGAKHGMKHGGSVKGKCKVDGIAIRGRTRAKHK